jgi:peptidoglycan/xylan/chitin deacetylase (PgdA/CDA1 family)
MSSIISLGPVVGEKERIMLKKLTASISALLLMLLPFGQLVSAATTNPIANPALQGGTQSGSTITLPGWSHSDWMVPANAFTPTYDYVTTDGHGDNTSVKVNISGYDRTYVAGAEDGTQGGAITGDAGDAKWVFDALPVTTTATAGALQVGKQYRFNSWFKGSVAPKVVADYIDATGAETFFGMPNPLTVSATNWTKYSDTFTIPQNATAVTIFMFLDQNGWIQTDDYSIEDYTPTGWSEPLLSLTFDDGHEDNVTNLLPLLTQYGYKTTQCFETGTLIANPAQAQTNVGAFLNAGHEICSHTITHPMLTQINNTQLANELTQSKSYLQNIVGNKQVIDDFASPYGDYDQRVNDAIKAAGYASHRTVDEGFNSKDNFDAYRIRVQNIFYDSASTKTTTAAQVAAWIAEAKADNTWLVLVYHRVVDTSKAGQAGYEAPGPYDTSTDVMKQHLDAIKASGIKVATMHDALAEVEGQLNGTPVDTTAPTFGTLTTSGITQNGATVNFTTSESTQASVAYGTTAAYTTTAQSAATGTTHSVALTGLTPNTTYHYQVTIKDAANNTTQSSDATFTTTAAPASGPVISNVTAAPVGTTSATVSWNSDVIATSTFDYGTTTAYGKTITDPLTKTQHFVNLTGLTANTTYYFKISVTNLTGQTTTYTGQFKTAATAKTGDLTGDGIVDDDDATILFANWGNSPKAGDIDKNGVVNDDDATLLFANWSKK